ncbi:hypothetical protein BDD14_1703 [Edaphobacter modestus]|uniref:Uncharacterized protein n=1 Tax=Edaphobacter modestus TaxID=388466 RepID=A0A4Q7YRD0_9BACT|nr:hypothetical protein BDD14_1703 [Edaphobacter modestus]
MAVQNRGWPLRDQIPDITAPSTNTEYSAICMNEVWLGQNAIPTTPSVPTAIPESADDNFVLMYRNPILIYFYGFHLAILCGTRHTTIIPFVVRHLRRCKKN